MLPLDSNFWPYTCIWFMTAEATSFSAEFSRKLTLTHLFIDRVVQHCAAISATAELLLFLNSNKSAFTVRLRMQTHGHAVDICLFFRPSVKRVHCDKTKSTAKILIPYKRSIHHSFLTGRMVGGGRPLVAYLKIFGQTDPVPSKTPIFNWFSLVAPQP